jgi:hypothetical protein
MIIENYTLLNPEHRFVVGGIAFGRKDIPGFLSFPGEASGIDDERIFFWR